MKNRYFAVSPIGLNGRNSDQFKDFPFIPVVTAPKIVLLVPDKLMQDLNTRTQVLMATVFNTWPMLIFIIVSAMLAGLTVWLLVSSACCNIHLATFMTQNDSSIDWLIYRAFHCVKSVLIRSFSGPYFPAFRLNTGQYWQDKLRMCTFFPQYLLSTYSNFLESWLLSQHISGKYSHLIPLENIR